MKQSNTSLYFTYLLYFTVHPLPLKAKPLLQIYFHHHLPYQFTFSSLLLFPTTKLCQPSNPTRCFRPHFSFQPVFASALTQTAVSTSQSHHSLTRHFDSSSHRIIWSQVGAASVLSTSDHLVVSSRKYTNNLLHVQASIQ